LIKNSQLIALLGIVIISVNLTPVFGQVEVLLDPISVMTDKSSYSDGETIFVTGEVMDLLSGFQVSLQIFAPNGNQVNVQQFDVGEDKKFSTEFTTGGPLMRQAGEYTIKVLYGTSLRTAETTFEFGGSSESPAGTPTSQPTIGISGTIFSINYMITGGQIISIETNPQDNTLLIEIIATDDGELTIVLPRSVIDAKFDDGSDDVFFVLIDGQEEDFTETKTTEESRTLKIEFVAGSEEIEILGTYVTIPEFGTIAVMILAIAIISIIAISSKTRLSIIPRY
jgi:predicted secreted protein with PEFG-CTERM motif